MQHIPLEGGAVEVVGMLDVDRTDAGITPRRLPGWTRPQVPSEMERVVRTPSGGRIRFRTDSASVGLDMFLSHLHLAHEPFTPAVIELEVDGRRTARRTVPEGEVVVVDLEDPSQSTTQPGGPVRVRFHDLPAEPKDVQLWLPQGATVELRSLVIDDGAVIEPVAHRSRPIWVHHGSSISQCREADAPTSTWPVIAARRADVEVVNLGFGGQCHIDPFVARTIGDLPADLISLELGINVVNADSLRERAFVPAVHGFLDSVRDRHPAAPVLVVSPISCPAVEDRPGPTVLGPGGRWVAADRGRSGPGLTVARVRSILAAVVDSRRAAGDEHLHHLDGRDLLGPADVHHLADGLHPDADGYRLMGRRFAERAFGPGGPFSRR